MTSLNLNNLERNALNMREMALIKGGNWICTCSCYWAGQGGASEMDNGCANAQIPGGGHSTEGDNHYQVSVTTDDPYEHEDEGGDAP